MKGTVAAFVAIVVAACSSADPTPTGPCAQRIGTYLTRYQEHPGGTCGYLGDELATVTAQPTGFNAPCNGTISYSADNCIVTFDYTCPSSISPGAKLRRNGKATWNSDGTRGEVVVQWAGDDPTGNKSCLSVYDAVVTKQ